MSNSFTRGIFAGDIVLRDVIRQALDRLRARPYLLDDVFRALEEDAETAGRYGARESAQAKEWFLHQDVPVRIADGPEPPVATSLVLEPAGGGEDAATLADVHHEVTDVDARVWAVLAGPLDPVSYDVATGVMVFSDDVTLVIAPGMLVVDREGRELPVLAAPATRVLRLAAGTRGEFRGMTIRGARPPRAVTLASIQESESYTLTVAAYGKPVYLSWLYAIVHYALLWARQALETRGMERVRYSYQPPAQDSVTGVEALRTRGVVVTLMVRQIWVQDEQERIATVSPDVEAVPVGGAFDDSVDVLGG